MKLVESASANNSDEDRIWSCDVVQNGSLIITCSGRSVHFWKFKDEAGELLPVYELKDVHERSVRSIAYNEMYGLLATASFDSTIKIWRKINGDEATKNDNNLSFDLLCTLEGHESEVKSISWNSGGNLLASCSRDKSVWIWAYDERDEDFECIAVLLEHTQDVKMVRWHPTEDIVVSCSYDDTIKVWREDDEDWYCAQTLVGHESTVWAVEFSGDGNILYSVGDDMLMKVWGLENRRFRCLSTFSGFHSRCIYSVSAATVGDLIATCAGDNSITISRNGKILQRIDEAHSSDVNCVKWMSIVCGNSNLISVGDDGALKAWRLTPDSSLSA